MIRQESRETYGSPRIWNTMIQQGHGVGEYRIARLMRVEGIRAKTITKWRATTQSNHRWPVAENTLKREFTIAQLYLAPTAGLLYHSDRGSQYAATSDQRFLDEYSITTSMSRKGYCWDNACVESFFGTLTRELVSHRHSATREDATQDIFEYIEMFYNQQRRHSTLGYDSPAEYEARPAVVNQVSTELGDGHAFLTIKASSAIV